VEIKSAITSRFCCIELSDDESLAAGSRKLITSQDHSHPH